MKGDFRISGHLVQPSLNAIVGSAATARVEPKAMQVLVLLAERAGEVVLKEDLMRAVWTDTFVTDDVLVHAISDLRRALEDDSRQPQIIQTVPKSGYRLIPAVQPADGQKDGSGNGEPARIAAAEIAPLPRESARFRPLPVLVPAVLLVAGAFAAGLLVGRGRSVPEAQPSFQRLTFQNGAVYSARFSPDNRTIVYSAQWGDGPMEIYSARPEFPESLPLNQATNLLLSVSSTGSMAVARGPTIFLGLSRWGTTLAEVPLVGGEARDILAGVLSADYGPDGKTMAVARIVNGETLLEYPPGNILFRTHGWITNVRVSPDGTRVAFLNHTMQIDDRGDVAVTDRSGNLKTLSSGWESEQGLAWSPRGDEVWFTAAKSGVVLTLYGVTLSGKLRIVHAIVGGWIVQDVLRDGRALLTHTNERLEAWGAANRGAPPRNLSWLEASAPEDISSDGESILITEQGTAAGPNYLVAIRKLDGSRPVRLGEGRGLSLSPDGNWVLAAVASGTDERFVLLPTGAGETRVLTTGPMHHLFARWFPDGKRFAFVGTQEGHAPGLYIQDVKGGAPRLLAEVFPLTIAISPDGKKIAAGSLTGNGTLYSVDGGPAVHPAWLPPMEAPLRWAKDGTSIYTQSGIEKSVIVYRVNVATGKRTKWFDAAVNGLVGEQHGCVALSEDGEHYALALERWASDLYLATGLK